MCQQTHFTLLHLKLKLYWPLAGATMVQTDFLKKICSGDILTRKQMKVDKD